MPRKTKIQLRRDTASNWSSVNPVLASGEIGVESDTGRLKVGDGNAAWTSLKYVQDASKISGTTLNSSVKSSSLTSVGTLSSLAVSGATSSGSISSSGLTTTSSLKVSGLSAGPLSAAADGSVTSGSVSPSYGGVPTGAVFQWVASSAPSGYALCDGSVVSQTTYASLYAVIGATYNTGGEGAGNFRLPNLQGRAPMGYQEPTSLGTATITIAAPGVVTRAAHGLSTGQIVYFTTTGALPTGIAATTGRYWVIVLTTSTFQLASSLANAVAGTAITTTGTQSGTHTVYSADFELGRSNGKTNHTLSTTEMPSHTHTQNAHGHSILDPSHSHGQRGPVWKESGGNVTLNTSGGAGAGVDQGDQTSVSGTGITIVNATATNQNTGGGLPHNNLQPYLVTRYIIKT